VSSVRVCSPTRVSIHRPLAAPWRGMTTLLALREGWQMKSFCSLISSFILKSIFLYSAKTNLHSGNSEIGYNGIGC
ncbi:unnamed protein product, partial [Musa hybrid cultivar]